MRVLLLGLVAAFGIFGSAVAQQNRSTGLTARAGGKRDTLIIPGRNLCPLIDTHAQASFNRLAAVHAMKAVPLAGQKAYFGKNNDFMNLFCRQYLSSRAKTLNVVKGRSRKQFPLIDNILTKNQLPKELKYLAVIESALNNKALSGVGAYGPWQLMPGTAEWMGLTVNEKRDDRTDWYKSTQAAARYLRMLYADLGDWLLVVAAYNSGPTPVLRAIQKTGSRNFWDIKKHLPRETQGHVLAFVATATIFEKMNPYIASGQLPADFRFSPDDAPVGLAAATPEPVKPVFTDDELKSMAIVRLKDPIATEVLFEEMSMDLKLLNKWNPDYSMFVYGAFEEEFYGLRIPKDRLDEFLTKKGRMTDVSRKILGDEDNKM